MNGHLFAAEQIHAQAGQFEAQWTCLKFKMVIKSIIWYPPGYSVDLRQPGGYPLTSCAEMRKSQVNNIVNLTLKI